MITLSADLTEALKARSKNVRIVLEISGLTNASGKTILYTTGPIQAAGSDVRALLTAPEGNSSSLDIREAQATFSSIGFDILDRDREITSKLATVAFRGKTATLKIGLASVPFANYVQVYVGIIQDFKRSGGGLSYSFSTVDVQVNLDQFAFILATTKLSAAITTLDTSISVDEALGFATAGPFVNHEDQVLARGHFLIGSGDSAELVEWTGKTSNTFDALTRGVLGSNVGTFPIGTQVKEVVVWPGHPLEILSVVLSGNTIEEGAAYANVPSGWKMISTVSLDATTWLVAKDRTREFMWEYRTVSKQFARNFAQLEVLQPLRLFIRSTATNALALVELIERPDPLNLATQVDKDKETFDVPWNSGASKVSNQVVVFFDFSLFTGQFDTQVTINDTASQAKYGVISQRTYSLKGLRTDLGGADQAELIGLEHFNLFGDLRPEMEVMVFSDHLAFEIGDPVRITHPRIPTINTASLGVSQRFMKLIGNKLSLATLGGRWTLYDPDVPAANLYGSVAVDGTNDFPDADAITQATRLFIGRSFRTA